MAFGCHPCGPASFHGHECGGREHECGGPGRGGAHERAQELRREGREALANGDKPTAHRDFALAARLDGRHFG